MSVLSYLALGVGLLAIAGGLVLPDRVRSPWDGLVAFLAPAGLATALIGVLLICVPDFFDAPASGSAPPAEATRSLSGDVP